MSHLAPRPPQRPTHHRTRSDTQIPDKRLELVGKLEGCIREVLDATNAYKSPQQHAAHQNANQMFQQRVMASQSQMGDMSSQDWVGTMMQCLNESMKTQQSSFVRNTTLDVALKTFASGIFEALGLAYFQEPFDKYMAVPKPNVAVNTAIAHHAPANSGIPSPPREIGPGTGFLQRPGLIPPPSHRPPFPSAHHQLAQRPRHGVSPGVAHLPQDQLHGMPILQRTVPPAPAPAPAPASRPGRLPKRPSPSDISNPASRKRAYTSEALRQAAGPMGPPPPPPAQARTNAPRPRLCIDIWDVQQERDPRRRQAILGYGGKWYVFQCHQHQEVLFFKTAEGARHHLITRHALPNQHIDFLDIVQELGVEVMHCDVVLAEKNNHDAVNMWKFAASNSTASPVESPVAQQGAVLRREVLVPVKMPVRTPLVTTQPRSVSQHFSAANPEPTSLPTPQLDSPSIVFLSDDEEEATLRDQTAVGIKREIAEKEIGSYPEKLEQTSLTTTPGPITEASKLASRAIETLNASQTPSVPASNKREESPAQEPLAQEPLEALKSHEKQQAVEPAAKESAIPGVWEAPTESSTVTPDIPERIPDLAPDSPQSSELSEPPSLQDLESFAPRPSQEDAPKVVDDELEEGEIDESTIVVASYSPEMQDKVAASPDVGKKKKRRISGVTSSSPASAMQRKKLPSTPKSSLKKRTERQSFWSPQQEGPSAHDQFKTKACKKCNERFYFRAQLATHMMSEHPEVVLVE